MQKDVYKKLVLHISQPNRRTDVLIDGKDFNIEVQPEEIRMAACLQIILDSGWSLRKENFEDFLDLSGIKNLQEIYWNHIKSKKEHHINKELATLKSMMS